jgi:acyl-CoA synthetase (AMP-forming)/AMP-acid ligase II
VADGATLFRTLIDETAAEQPERVALEDRGARFSYDGLAELVRSAAAQLAGLGVARGDRVLITLPNSAEFLIAVLAAASMGAIAVPLPTGASRDRLDYVARATGARLALVLGAAGARGPSPIPAVELLLDRHCRRLVLSPASALASDAAPADAAAEDPALILFSSGSTGRPKGVVLKHRHLLATARTLAAVFGLGPAHRELILCPLCHSDGWQRAAATWAAGGCVVLGEGPLSVQGLLEDASELGITGFFTPPPLLRILLRLEPARVRAALARCRSLETGSAPLTAAELTALSALLPETRLFFHYGLTECSRAVILDVARWPDRRGTVGRTAPGVELAILDEDGRPVTPDESGERTGEIAVRGPQLTDGYWAAPEIDRERLVDGWLRTGDHGRLGEDGFLVLRGRRDDLITCGGYHYFPAEVEAELGPVQGVLDYLVAGIPDAQGLLEQVPWAFAVPRDPQRWTPAAFMAEARARLPPAMVPRRVIAVPGLPAGPSGKPDRRRTVALYGPAPASVA